MPDPKDACKHGYVLKVLNSLDSKSSALIDAQNKMMLFLSKLDSFCDLPLFASEIDLSQLTT